MPGTPIQETNDTSGKPQAEPAAERKYEQPPVREITQTDHLNKKLLTSLLERMKKSTGEFDQFMEKRSTEAADSDENSDF